MGAFPILVAALAASLLAACTRELVVLLPDDGGEATGAVVVQKLQDRRQSLVLDQPYRAARLDRQGRVAPRTLTAAAVRRQFAAALGAKPPAPEFFTLYFEEGSTRLLPQSEPVLQRLLDAVERRRPAVDVQITGHTDTVGDAAYNDRLSRQRAAEIRAVLIGRGLRAPAIVPVGRGERQPLVPTADGVAQPRNRRVEVTVR
ncbi:MAG: OmpA family protein [Pseudomonadota bacterium]|nr:OmpA family protein [Pseudomonadota bacterium]